MIDLITYRVRIGIFNLKSKGPKKKSGGVDQKYNRSINLKWGKILLIFLAIYSTYRVDSYEQGLNNKAVHITNGNIKRVQLNFYIGIKDLVFFTIK